MNVLNKVTSRLFFQFRHFKMIALQQESQQKLTGLPLKHPIDPSSIPVEMRVELLISQFSQKGEYPYDLGDIDGQRIRGTINCSFPITLNPHFSKNKDYSFNWLQEIGALPKLDSNQASEQEKLGNSLDTLRRTNITLLAALTLPEVSEEGLKLAGDVNAWLFFNDNLFNSRNSPFFKQPVLVKAIFNEYLKAFQGGVTKVPEDVPIELKPKIEALIRGIAEIGKRLQTMCSSTLFERVKGGLVKYCSGNIQEARKRSLSNPEYKISITQFNINRDNAGAVDLVFEIMFAILGAEVSDEVLRDVHWSNVRNFAIKHICYFNDIVSAKKEKEEGLKENLVLLYESQMNISFEKAVKCVEDEINNIVSDIQMQEQLFQESFSETTIQNSNLSSQEKENAIKAINAMKTWVIGHVVWELVSFEGRHPKHLVLDLFPVDVVTTNSDRNFVSKPQVVLEPHYFSSIFAYFDRPILSRMACYTHPLGKVLIDSLSADFIFPTPPTVNPHVEEVQQKVVPFAKQFGLYTGYEELLERSKFAWLPGYVHPYLTSEQLEGVSLYLTALFAHDDAIDIYIPNKELKPKALEVVNLAIEEVLSGVPLSKLSQLLEEKYQIKDPSLMDVVLNDNRLKAMEFIYVKYFEPLVQKGINYTFFLETLHKYLQSTVLEAEQIHESASIKELDYLENRRHTGGGENAFAAICFLLGIDIPICFKQYLRLSHMLGYVVDAIGLLNDIYSLPKEVRELQKKVLKESGNTSDAGLIKSKVTSNLVLIKWREGLSLTEAISYTNKKYFERLNVYFLNRNALLKSYSSDPILKAVIFAMDGWLFGHPAWAVGSGRYNPDCTLSLETVPQFIEKLEQNLVEFKLE